jgi:hypothetical protein
VCGMVIREGQHDAGVLEGYCLQLYGKMSCLVGCTKRGRDAGCGKVTNLRRVSSESPVYPKTRKKKSRTAIDTKITETHDDRSYVKIKRSRLR